MTITTRDQLISAMGNNSSRIVIDKASISSVAAGVFASLWRANGQPGQGAVPAAAAACSNLTTGAIGFIQQTTPATSYGTHFYAATSNPAMVVELHDRLAHMGGLVGNLASAQTVNIDFSTLTTNNMAERKGDANYSDIQWWLEWYTATGATAVTATVAVTYNDGTTGTLSVPLAATRPASLMIPLNGYIPAAGAGKYIRAITSVTLSATTGTAGSFGVTATRPRITQPSMIANLTTVSDWAALGLPEIFNESCLFPLVMCSTTTTGTVRGGGKISHG